MSTAQPATNALFSFIDDIKKSFREGQYPAKFTGAFGEHGVTYSWGEEGIFASIGMTLPDDVYAEIEDGTYGELNAFRIYLTDVDKPERFVVFDDGGYAEIQDDGNIAYWDNNLDPITEIFKVNDRDYSHYLGAIVSANRALDD